MYEFTDIDLYHDHNLMIRVVMAFSLKIGGGYSSIAESMEATHSQRTELS